MVANLSAPIFIQILAVNRVKYVPTTIKNLQANVICERMHQTAGNVIHTLTYAQPPQDILQANHIVDLALAMTMHAIRCAMHHALGMLPGAFDDSHWQIRWSHLRRFLPDCVQDSFSQEF
jgi:hypothetical protein